MLKKYTLFLLLFWTSWGFAQQTFPSNGVKDSRNGLYAFTNATIHTSYNQTLENASLVIRKGKIEAVGKSVAIPQDAVVIDLKGKHIYPSFVEIYSDYGMPEVKKGGGGSWGKYQVTSNKEGAFSWNQALKTEFEAHQVFKPMTKAATDLQKTGFGVANVHRMDGISRGTSTLVALADKRPHELILQERAAHHFSFRKGTSTQSYPGSLMGGIALLRQTYLDGLWYKNHGHKEEINNSLQAWNAMQNLPQIFEVGNKQEALRASKIAQEYDKKYILVGKGDEYQRLDEIKATGMPIVVTLDYPKAFEVDDPLEANRIALGDLKHWELAPSNAAMLTEAGVEIVFSTFRLEKKGALLGNIRQAIERGLSEEMALKALTHTPAKLLHVSDKVGSLEKGKLANFLITSNSIFDKKNTIHHNWILGQPKIFKALDVVDLAGSYDLKVNQNMYDLKVDGELEKPKFSIIVNDSTTVKVKHHYKNGLIALSFKPDGEEDIIRLSGTAESDKWAGSGQLGDGTWVKWTAHPKSADAEESEKESDKEATTSESDDVGAVTYPLVAYGWEEKPKAETVLFKNATVWTNESDGILENTDVLIQNGKIIQIGEGLSVKNATVIDAEGKHLTSGIIDEHSHIAISRGVNECTQESTAEVRIGDVINADDVDIYRQLSGGVTISQLLHGSCNPIGGQSALIKLRWGYAPEAMKYEGADGFIKFALGENVKRSWSDDNTRFPDTRMGVEQVYVDFFTRAQEYQTRKRANDPTLRKDLEMETLSEILNSKRFITCHSYVQSEINMLMHVADNFDFKVNTFTHILEGYKVADEMKEHGVGGSTFSDWWAYKYEVIDAIPQNGELLHKQGVTVAFNSDDAEMARRLNQEAAKAIMYGDMSEEEAWKFVTLNPAKLLHIDDRVGSIKVGKDADVVLWSANPLSIYAKAEQTYVDGIKFFDRADDLRLRQAIQDERARLIQKMLAAKKGGAATQGAKGKHKHHYHCDHADDEMY